MNKQKNGIWSIVGLLALVVVLFIGVKIAFAGLDVAIGQKQPQVVRQPVSTESGSDSAWMLLAEYSGEETVAQWLEKADRSDRAYWLENQETGEYLLYLPMQDRTLDVDDLTVTEEESGLVLRVRTAEDSQAASQGQLLTLQNFHSAWDGEQVRAILDGRELEVQKCIAAGGQLYWSGED